MIAVVDASVVIKWLLQDPEREADTERATRIMELVTISRRSHSPASDDSLIVRRGTELAQATGRIMHLRDWT